MFKIQVVLSMLMLVAFGQKNAQQNKTLTLADKIQEIEQQIERDEARHLALMRIRTGEKIISQNSKQNIAAPVQASQTILNRLIEVSVTPLENQLYTVIPVRPFTTTFGSEVTALTLLVDQQVKLLDTEGNTLDELSVTMTETKNNTKLPPFAPKDIIKSPHANDPMFAIISEGRLDGFRLYIEDSEKLRRNVTLVHDWAVSLAEQNVTEPILAHSASKQKGKFRVSLLDSKREFVSFLRDGRKEAKALNFQDFANVTWIQPMTHSLLLQEETSVSFFRFGSKEVIQPCKMDAKVLDFTWDPTSPNYLYVLNAAKQIVLFELNMNRNTCKSKGHITLEKAGSSLQIWASSALAVINEDGSMTVVELAGDIYEFEAKDGNLPQAQYPVRCKAHCAQSKSQYLVVRICDSLLTIQNTMGRKEVTQKSQDYSKYGPQVIFLVALGFTGWYQYRKITQKNAEKVMQKGKAVGQGRQGQSQAMPQPSSQKKRPMSMSDQLQDDDDDDYANQKKVRNARMPSGKQQEDRLQALQAQIQGLEGTFQKNLGGMTGQIDTMSKNYSEQRRNILNTKERRDDY